MKLKHNNKGFSLVELIVVIAIMAILGGVGTAGYTKYIEQTNKKADMAMVGNVMRAIETSAADISNTGFNNLSKYNTLDSIPVGFVILSQDGDIQTISVDTEGTAVENSLTKTENFYYYSHSIRNSDYYDSVSVKYLLDGASINRATIKNTHGQTISNAALFAGSTFTRVDENTKTYNTNNSTLLSNALASAFGDDYATNMRLKYDKWANEGNALNIHANVQETWARLMNLLESNAWVLGNFTNADSLMKSAVDGLVSARQIDSNGNLTISEENFMARWLAPGSKGGEAKNETFGINDQTVYTGLRSAWNSYLADYISTNSSCPNRILHSSKISNYKDKNSNSWAALSNVRVVTHDILTGADQYSEFECSACAETLQEYLADKSENGILYKNGIGIYESFAMAAAASQDQGLADVNYSYSAYFSDYMGQMDTIYSAVNDSINSLESENQSYIVISVTSNHGVVECEVIRILF